MAHVDVDLVTLNFDFFTVLFLDKLRHGYDTTTVLSLKTILYVVQQLYS